MTVSLVLTGCGSSDDDGTVSASGTDSATADVLGPVAAAVGTPVRIGMITDGRGPAGDQSIEGPVADATVAWLNEHRSGIAGRPIELVKCDALSDPAKTADCGNLMVEEEVAAVVVGSLAAGESAWNPIHDAGVPMMFYGAGGEALRDPDSTFSLGDPYAGTIGVPLQLAKDEGVDKVTAVVIDVPPALTVPQTVAPGIFEEAGIDWEVVTVPPGTADMTPQMQNVVDGNPGIVFVLGNDAFCIAAFNGLRAVGYDGRISAISQCVTDATRTAVPSDLLDGMVLAASAPIGTDNPSTQLYNAVMETYSEEDVDTSRISGYSMFTAVAGFQAAVQDISGDITPDNIIATIKAMPERELPGAGGLMFRCNGKANPDEPAICVRGGLSTTLDGDGNPAEYTIAGASPIED